MQNNDTPPRMVEEQRVKTQNNVQNGDRTHLVLICSERQKAQKVYRYIMQQYTIIEDPGKWYRHVERGNS
jgi:hypothetical protein